MMQYMCTVYTVGQCDDFPINQTSTGEH